MLTDSWDIAHICVAVPDLPEAMAFYEKAYGVTRWGPLIEFGDVNLEVVSPLYGPGASLAGGREIWAMDGSVAALAPGVPPFAPLELANADRFTPGHAIYGCPDGKHYVHHICYWVDDLEAESAHLVENGYSVELTVAPGDPIRGFAYFLSPFGLRVELMNTSDKRPLATFLEGGPLELDWA